MCRRQEPGLDGCGVYLLVRDVGVALLRAGKAHTQYPVLVGYSLHTSPCTDHRLRTEGIGTLPFKLQGTVYVRDSSAGREASESREF